MSSRFGSASPVVLSWAVLLGLACVALGAAEPAGAASLTLNGPPGATVFIDGVEQGILPLEPIGLAQGPHTLRCTLPGYRTHVEEFVLTGRDHDLTLTVSMLEFSRWRATGLSVLWAGLGQHYQDRRTAGWTMMAVEAVAAGFAIYGELEFKNQRNTYEDAVTAYERAVDRLVLAEEKEKAQQAYDDMEKAETIRNVALWAVLGTVVVSAVDAWLAHDDLVVRTGEPTLGEGGVDQPLQVGWRVRF